MIRRAIGRTVGFVTEHNRITLVVMGLLTVGVLLGIPQLDTGSQASVTSEDFPNLDAVQASEHVEAAYDGGPGGNGDRTVAVVYVRDQGGDVLTKSSLLEGLRFQRDLLENESVATALRGQGVTGIENLVAARAAGAAQPDLETQIQALEQLDPSAVEDLVEETTSGQSLAQAYLPTGHEPGDATSPDRRLLVTLGTGDEGALAGAQQAVYETATERSDAGFFTLGEQDVSDYSDHFFGQMVELVLPIALALILVVLAFTYRDIVDVIVGMTGVLLAILWMFGLLGWLGVAAGLISIVPVILVTGLSIDFGFHVFNRYREQRGEDEAIRPPMARGVTLVATALILVTVTAAIGFLSNLTNPAPVIRELGVSITIGVVASLVLFVTVVPALKISLDGILERFGLDCRKRALGHGRFLEPALGSTVTLARRGAVVVLLVAVIAGGAGGAAWFALDEESFQQPEGEVPEWKQNLPGPLGWETDEFPERLDHVQATYQPPSADDATRAQILVEGPVASGESLSSIEAGIDRLRESGLVLDQPGTQAVHSPLAAMEALAAQDEAFADAFAAADTDGDGVPDTDVADLYDRLYAADTDLAGSVIERTGDDDYQSVLVTVALDIELADVDRAVSAVGDGADAMEAGDGDLTATPAGTLSVNDAILGALVAGILRTMIIAVLAIVLTLTLVFRAAHGSASLGTVVAVPIALVIGMVIGGMYILDIPLTLLTALLMSLVIGLGVDYNIHVGDRFADELRAGHDPISALSTAVTGTGGALLGSTLTSAGAFAAIILVPHPQLQSFGAIVVIALVTALLVSVLVLPSLLLLWTRYGPGSVADEARAPE